MPLAMTLTAEPRPRFGMFAVIHDEQAEDRECHPAGRVGQTVARSSTPRRDAASFGLACCGSPRAGARLTEPGRELVEGLGPDVVVGPQPLALGVHEACVA
jgi:hypothetical protein